MLNISRVIGVSLFSCRLHYTIPYVVVWIIQFSRSIRPLKRYSISHFVYELSFELLHRTASFWGSYSRNGSSNSSWIKPSPSLITVVSFIHQFDSKEKFRNFPTTPKHQFEIRRKKNSQGKSFENSPASFTHLCNGRTAKPTKINSLQISRLQIMTKIERRTSEKEEKKEVKRTKKENSF